VNFTYTITATGPGTITLGATGLPTWMTLGANGVLSGTPIEPPGVVNVTLSATNANGADTQVLSVTILPAISDPPSVDPAITVSRLPAPTGEPVTFTALGRSLSGQPLTFTWQFFPGDSPISDGPPLPGNPVTRSFSTEGSYTAVVVASDGFAKSNQSRTIMVTLAPNPGAAAQNIFNDSSTSLQNAVMNPLNSLGVAVPSSGGGVLDFDAQQGGAKIPTSKSPGKQKFSLYTKNSDNVAGIDSASGGTYTPISATAGRFAKSGVYSVQLTDTSTGTAQIARALVPVSDMEAGGSVALADTRSSKQPMKYSVSGKFSAAKPDSITASVQIELAQGIDLSQPLTVSLGMSNVTTDVSFNSKGKAAPGYDPLFSRMSAIMPKVDKKTHLTVKGATMIINFTITAKTTEAKSRLHDAVSTEGIVNGTKDQMQLGLQFAAVISGMTYRGLLSVGFTPTGDFGNISDRSKK